MGVDFLRRGFNNALLLMLGVYFLQRRARKLNQNELLLLTPYFNAQLLKNAEIVEGNAPFWLQKKMAAVVLGHRIFFRKPLLLNSLQITQFEGEKMQYKMQAYLNDIEILAHELVHVEQYANGMNILKYAWASRHGYFQNPYEIEAYAKAAHIKKAYQNKK